jgi:hypothetical protein
MAIGSRQQARIADNEHTPIRGIANQTPRPLLEGDDRLGELKVAKRVTTAATQGIDARLEHWVPR